MPKQVRKPIATIGSQAKLLVLKQEPGRVKTGSERRRILSKIREEMTKLKGLSH